MATLAPQIHNKLFENVYTIHDPNEVGAFLESHPPLIALLSEAYSRITSIFGADSAPILQMKILWPNCRS